MNAHQAETWAEWDARLAANRKQLIAAEADPSRKAELAATDRTCNAATAFAKSLATGGGFPPS